MLAIVLPAAHGQAPVEVRRGKSPAGAPIGGTLDAGEGGRARLGLAGEGHDESRDAAAALQPRQRAAPPGQADHELHDLELRPRLYCEVGKHFDYIWFEMQHSTMSYDEVRRMILTCPRVGAAPMIRMPDALESSIQKATDLGALGIIVPTVDDALEARDAARFSRYPPFGRRSAGGGAYRELWNAPGTELSRDDQRQHARDGDDRDAGRRGDGQRDRGDARRRRHHPGQQRPVELLRAGARTIRAIRTRSSRCTTRRSSTASTTGTPASST